VPLRTRDCETYSHAHAVQFYADDAELLAGVGPYLADALRAGRTAIVIATATHRRAFERALEADGVDVARALAAEQLISRDAAGVLATLRDDAGEIDSEAFHEVVGGLVRAAGESGRAVSAYGEMVALLWSAGDVLGAIRLETLWNELGRELRFSLYCSYQSASVAGAAHAEALRHVCDQHSLILGPASVSDRRRGRERCSPRSLTADFPAAREAPGRARRLIVDQLRRWMLAEDIVDDAALIISELASNAVRHAGSPFSVSLRLDSATLTLAVEDTAELAAAVPDGALSPQPLHGLGVIEAIALDWGVEALADGKVVWAQLEL